MDVEHLQGCRRGKERRDTFSLQHAYQKSETGRKHWTGQVRSVGRMILKREQELHRIRIHLDHAI